MKNPTNDSMSGGFSSGGAWGFTDGGKNTGRSEKNVSASGIDKKMARSKVASIYGSFRERLCLRELLEERQGDVAFGLIGHRPHPVAHIFSSTL
jgi:hypothetical protein